MRYTFAFDLFVHIWGGKTIWKPFFSCFSHLWYGIQMMRMSVKVSLFQIPSEITINSKVEFPSFVNNGLDLECLSKFCILSTIFWDTHCEPRIQSIVQSLRPMFVKISITFIQWKEILNRWVSFPTYSHNKWAILSAWWAISCILILFWPPSHKNTALMTFNCNVKRFDGERIPIRNAVDLVLQPNFSLRFPSTNLMQISWGIPYSWRCTKSVLANFSLRIP